MKLLITGAAGFIGFHLTKVLVERGDEVFAIDFIGDYYDIQLKYDRLNELGIDENKLNFDKPIKSKLYSNLTFQKLNIANKALLINLFQNNKFECVVNLAAQAGVRYSLSNPDAYLESNFVGFLNMIECCRNFNIKNFIYASSSSVYGLNQKIPFSENDGTSHPISLYAASKKSNELMAHVYSHLFGMRTTGLRFFTVYGPWGRPDMAAYLFTRSIIDGKAIKVFNNGNMLRDFTYVDDIVNGILKVVDNSNEPTTRWDPFQPLPSFSSAPFRIYNIGCSNPIKLIDFIKALEIKLCKTAVIKMLPIQPGDVISTFAEMKSFENDFQYKPRIDISEGVGKYIDWFIKYYK
jgi:UDP-glucuronate 4-epimerase